jgi:hypothetical protein
MLCYIPVAHLADKYGRRPFVLITFVFFTLFPVTLLWAHNFAWLALAFVVRGTGRLCGGVLRGGPGQEGHPYRKGQEARRRLPESRLHPLQGAALRDSSNRQRARVRPSRHHICRAEGGRG